MRIAIATESFPPNISGVAVAASELAAFLTSRGHQVLVCTPSPTGRPYGELWNGAEIRRIRSVRNPLRPKFRLVVQQQRTVSSVLRAFRPDLLHVHDPGGTAQAAMNWAAGDGTPAVGTYHFSVQFVAAYFPFNLLRPRAVKPLVQAYCNDLYERCAVVTCPSASLRDELRRQGLRAPLEVHSNGVRLGPIPERPALLPAVPTVLAVGRLDGDKNLPLLLAAIPYVLAAHPAAFLFVGGGNKRGYVSRWIQRHGLQEHVRVEGPFPAGGSELARRYAEADVFAIPSLIETQSIVTLEAMAASLPVVAPRAAALPELVRDGVTGRLVSPPTPKRFAEAIIAYLHGDEARAHGAAGRADAVRHEREGVLRGVENLYRRVLAGEFAVPRKRRRLRFR